MLDFLRREQLNIMLFLSGVCFMLILLTWITKSLSPRRKRILTLLEATAGALLIFDRFAYLYRGDPSLTGFWMVRVSNFMVYALQVVLLLAINLYLGDLYRNEGRLGKLPKRLRLNEIFFAVDIGLLIVSQFTGMYYTFDETNTYHRAALMPLCYLFPLCMAVLQISVVIQYRNRISLRIVIMLLLTGIVPVAATALQFFIYGLSLTNIATVGMVVALYMFALYDLDETVRQAKDREIKFYQDEEKRIHRLFDQTAEALAAAIDAKDKYTRGHSARVAEYARKIAEAAGKSAEECDKIYFAGLLHDVGKIGVPDAIITKDGWLTEKEYAQIKMHPVYGNNILSRISEPPYLSIGAHYHHERYDGHGYPSGLKGEDIPEIARIISVADAYDSMTSKRSYHEPYPQDKVREELLKGISSQFDPQFARIMLQFIDRDPNYHMREEDPSSNLAQRTQLHFDEMDSDHTEGIPVIGQIVRVRFRSTADIGFLPSRALPTLVLFDALDGRMHNLPASRKDQLYFEYARIRADGEILSEDVRRVVQEQFPVSASAENNAMGVRYDYAIEAVRIKDHALVRISDAEEVRETILALPDASRFVYLALTGEHCTISNVRVDRDSSSVLQDYIPRIAPEISFVEGCPEGDLPNLQIDGWRFAATGGIPLSGETVLRFHTQSLPTARLVWHCPYIDIFTSDDGRVNGENYREYVLVRLDGESWSSDEHVDNQILAEQTDRFQGWNVWKEKNKQGLDITVRIRQHGSEISVSTENLGLSVRSKTVIKDDVRTVYAAITGDQCAISDIRISHSEAQ